LEEINVNDIDLDRIDLRILDHLQGHARASNLELAEAASLSPAQCHRRHRRLEEAGYVGRYETRLNAARMGLTVVAFIHVSMERSHIRELQKFKDLLGNLAEVQECYSVTGDFDYVLKVVARDLPALSRFLMDTLMRLPGVAAVRSSVCMDEIKCTSALPLPLPTA
jgi:Lrp/AsnC family transcriptional regulator, leucine-responsive regulatory protein